MRATECVVCGLAIEDAEAWNTAKCSMECTYVGERIKRRAYARVHLAISLGLLPRLKEQAVSCVDCGGRATCWDHRDYANALDVEPVCTRCNLKRGPGKYPRAA